MEDSGASISANRILCCVFALVKMVIVSPSAIPTTHPCTHVAANALTGAIMTNTISQRNTAGILNFNVHPRVAALTGNPCKRERTDAMHDLMHETDQYHTQHDAHHSKPATQSPLSVEDTRPLVFVRLRVHFFFGDRGSTF